jgi:hypothetical protein
MVVKQEEAKKKKKKKKRSEPGEKKEEKKKSIESETKKHEKIDGIFTIYRDSTSGKTKMVVSKDQLDQEYIYFSQIKDGVLEAGSFRGSYRDQYVFKITKFYDRLEFEKVNTSFYFDENNPLSKASDANISKAIMASEKIEVEDEEKGLYLINADNLFLKETLGQIKFSGSTNPNAFKLGNASKDKTKVLEINNYPENLNMAVEYVYDNRSPRNYGSSAVTDARYVSIQVYYSLLAMPENDYEPRFDDPRVGYFFDQVTDQTSSSVTPYRDLINRWHLKKKDPNAAVSDPVEPITWWIENTTPLEWREAIKEGVLAWNEAFEKAGFSNAMVVKIQPDDAEWDAGDIRYNVLRWTSSPNPPFGGYGPSFTNPKTGQILGADIMLEFVHHTNRVYYDNLYTMNANFGIGEAAHYGHEDGRFCSFGHMMQADMLFGQMIAGLEESSDEESLELNGLKEESMIELIMHEVGHTLGLNHNMKASQLLSPEELLNKKDGVLTGSVMDYVTINVTRDRSKQGNYYSTRVGPYDIWAIQFGYTPFNDDSEMKALLDRSTEPELMFGNDADDMRAPGKAIDPRVNTGDHSNDQIAYSIDRFKTVRDLQTEIKDKFTKEGQSYQELLQSFYILYGQYNGAAKVVSRFIGGVYVDRAMAGQPGGTQPYTPVAYADQKKAMKTLDTYVFAPDAWKVPQELYNYLALQRRGYNFFGGPEDPKIHDWALNIQRGVLAHILHQNTLQRIVDSEMYGNEYDLGEYMTDLNNAIFKADINGSVSTMRQNLQIEYTNKLAGIVTDPDRYDHIVRSMALYNLKQIDKLASNGTGNTLTKAHKEHLKLIVETALDD